MGDDEFLEERKRLVERLQRTGYISSSMVLEAMGKVPRHLFVSSQQQRHAYEDRPLPIGHGQTISAPHMVGMMCEYLDLQKGMKVLEVGAGSGYHAAVTAEMVGPAGHVYTIDIVSELVENAKINLEEAGYLEQVTVIAKDGTEGHPEAAPFDRVLVTAGAPDIPQPLIDQLKPQGIMVIPVGGHYFQELYVIRKETSGEIERRSIGSCAFVPLVGKYGWKL